MKDGKKPDPNVIHPIKGYDKEIYVKPTVKNPNMNGWFTVERIDAQTFAISEYRHWEETHCYLLCGQDKSALIDTGLGVSNI
jgi:hypothetical protein